MVENNSNKENSKIIKSEVIAFVWFKKIRCKNCNFGSSSLLVKNYRMRKKICVTMLRGMS